MLHDKTASNLLLVGDELLLAKLVLLQIHKLLGKAQHGSASWLKLLLQFNQDFFHFPPPPLSCPQISTDVDAAFVEAIP